MKSNTVKISGLSSNMSFGGAQSLVTYLSVIEIPCYFSTFKVPAELEASFQSIHNRTNSSRINELCDSIKRGLRGSERVPPLSLGFVIGGKPQLKKTRSNVTELTYSPSNYQRKEMIDSIRRDCP